MIARCKTQGYRPSTAGMRWERLLNDAYNGCRVDPLELAGEMGRYLLIEERAPGPEHPVVDLLCEVSFAASRADWPSPWSQERPEVVAEMIVTALNAGGCAVVDVDGARTDHRGALVDVLAAAIPCATAARSDMDGARVLLQAVIDAGFALVEVA